MELFFYPVDDDVMRFRRFVIGAEFTAWEHHGPVVQTLVSVVRSLEFDDDYVVFAFDLMSADALETHVDAGPIPDYFGMMQVSITDDLEATLRDKTRAAFESEGRVLAFKYYESYGFPVSYGSTNPALWVMVLSVHVSVASDETKIDGNLEISGLPLYRADFLVVRRNDVRRCPPRLMAVALKK